MDHQVLLRFLRQLEAAIPPPTLCHHAIVAGMLGEEWKAFIQVNDAGIFYAYYFEAGDESKSVETLVSEIKAHHATAIRSDNVQKGVGIGQFVQAEEEPQRGIQSPDAS